MPNVLGVVSEEGTSRAEQAGCECVDVMWMCGCVCVSSNRPNHLGGGVYGVCANLRAEIPQCAVELC
jgi:hypothetical protein